MVETSVRSPSYPTEQKKAESLIHQYLKKHDEEDLAEEYDLMPFPIRVQSLERTFADKLYAVADYYLADMAERDSRHLYDLYCMMPLIDIDASYRKFLRNLKILRMSQPNNPSANSSRTLVELLREIYVSDFYKSDYENCTKQLLYENVSYEQVKDNLRQVIEKLEE